MTVVRAGYEPPAPEQSPAEACRSASFHGGNRRFSRLLRQPASSPGSRLSFGKRQGRRSPADRGAGRGENPAVIGLNPPSVLFRPYAGAVLSHPPCASEGQRPDHTFHEQKRAAGTAAGGPAFFKEADYFDAFTASKSSSMLSSGFSVIRLTTIMTAQATRKAGRSS